MRFAATILGAVALFCASKPAHACATCYGTPEDPQTQGMNMAIFTLLGVTYGVFALMAGAGGVLWYTNHRRASGVPEAESPEPKHG